MSREEIKIAGHAATVELFWRLGGYEVRVPALGIRVFELLRRSPYSLGRELDAADARETRERAIAQARSQARARR